MNKTEVFFLENLQLGSSDKTLASSCPSNNVKLPRLAYATTLFSTLNKPAYVE